MHLITVFALLVFGHALADYPLQGDFLARAKNRASPLPGVPWWQALAAHAVIHAGMVGLVTGSLALALIELAMHALIDDLKCTGKINFNEDQMMHLLCKVWYVATVGVYAL